MHAARATGYHRDAGQQCHYPHQQHAHVRLPLASLHILRRRPCHHPQCRQGEHLCHRRAELHGDAVAPAGAGGYGGRKGEVGDSGSAEGGRVLPGRIPEGADLPTEDTAG